MEQHERLKRARIAAGFETASAAARVLGMRAVTYIGHENGHRSFMREAARYARTFGVDLTWLLTGHGDQPAEHQGTKSPRGDVRPAGPLAPHAIDMPRNVPVRGTVGASEPGKGAFQLTPDTIDFVRRPPGLEGVPGAYALYVENESMVPEFRPGQLVYVHPHRAPDIGGAVVIQTRGEAGELFGYLKILKARTALEVICEQHKPAGEVPFEREKVIALHRVLTLAELLGI